MARRFTMEMNKVKVPLVLVKNIGDHLLFAVVHQVGNDSNLLIVFYVQIMPDDFVMQLHRF
ncbi:GntR family transcriptional regulator [Escherichia coli]|nr:GntR family transcriptional regulator [Escherichia coli]